jgi:signal transduction histidine kinase
MINDPMNTFPACSKSERTSKKKCEALASDNDDLGTGLEQAANDDEQPGQVDERLREEQLLLKKMLRFQERDRKLLAYEIHDGLVQDATAAQMLLSTLLQFGSLPDDETRATIQEANALVQKTVNEARRLIGGLRPVILEELGLIAAINFLKNNLPPNVLKVDFIQDVHFERLEPLFEATIFRIVQQSIANIKRHSHSDRAEIRLTQNGDWMHLEIQDWGVGFDPSSVCEDRFGLQGIRERARLMRGRAVIDSAPGKGTLIIVDLPVTCPLENN